MGRKQANGWCGSWAPTSLDRVTNRTDAVAEMAFAAVRILTDHDPRTIPAGLRYRDLCDRVFAGISDLESRWREISGDVGWAHAAGLQLRPHIPRRRFSPWP